MKSCCLVSGYHPIFVSRPHCKSIPLELHRLTSLGNRPLDGWWFNQIITKYFSSFNQDIDRSFNSRPVAAAKTNSGRFVYALGCLLCVMQSILEKSGSVDFPKPIYRDYKHIRFLRGWENVLFALTCGLKSFPFLLFMALGPEVVFGTYIWRIFNLFVLEAMVEECSVCFVALWVVAVVEFDWDFGDISIRRKWVS